MSAVIAMLLLIVVLGLLVQRPDRRVTFVMILAIVAYLAYAYVSG